MALTASSFRGLRTGKLLKWVRRIHLYTGLAMLPWMLLFGVSGMLFNHPNIGAEVRGQPLPSAELSALTSVRPWAPETIANQVVAGLNAVRTNGERAHYTLDPEFESQLTGFTVLSAPASDGQHMLLLDMEAGGGVLVSRKTRASNPEHSFAPARVPLPEYSTSTVERQVAGLLSSRHLNALGELHAHPKIAPELRFRVRDAQQTSWNLTYDLRTGMVAGRRTDAPPAIGLTELLGKLHMTHHFPFQIGVLWFWALFTDLLGLTMVLWAVSGLVMWWQMKPTRLIGAVALSVALGIAALVMVGTADHLTFGDLRAKAGPGD
jgi:hypothetical protein